MKKISIKFFLIFSFLPILILINFSNERVHSNDHYKYNDHLSVLNNFEINAKKFEEFNFEFDNDFSNEKYFLIEEIGPINNTNSYILNNGFEIVNEQETSVEFYLEINDQNNEFNYEEPLKIKLNNENGEIVNATFLKKEDDRYYYQIDGLNEDTEYSIYSILDSGLATQNNTNEIDNEILIENDLGVSENNFKTSKSENALNPGGMNVYLFPMMMALLILVAAMFMKYKIKRNEF